MRQFVFMAGVAAGLIVPAAALADEFMALPGLWKTTFEVRPPSAGAHSPRVVWHCVDEEADPWVSFAQLRDVPGMVCSRTSLDRNSTSLKWRMECHGAGPAENADSVTTEGAVIFDSPQHYKGWVKFSGQLLGYPVQSATDFEGSRLAACTSPAD